MSTIKDVFTIVVQFGFVRNTENLRFAEKKVMQELTVLS